jgi:Winged helix DNA-binding domain
MSSPGRERLASQLLLGLPAQSPADVVDRLLAVQAQDPRGFRLAIRVRSRGFNARDVDLALDDRSLVVAWLNRGTMQLVRREDYPWLHGLTSPQIAAGNSRRLSQEGVTPEAADRGVATIEAALTNDGPLTREELRARMDAAGVRTEGQALVHILALAGLRGLVVRGPMTGGRQAFALARDWLGESPPMERDRALAELARRYLAGHGPAGERDLACWTGLSIRDAHAGFRAIGSELIDRGDGRASLRSRHPVEDPAAEKSATDDPARTEAAPRLMGPYEPLLLGWQSREPFLPPDLDPAAGRRLVSNGLLRQFALVGGRAAGLWRMEGVRLEVEPFTEIGAAESAALSADAAALDEFMGRSGGGRYRM